MVLGSVGSVVVGSVGSTVVLGSVGSVVVGSTVVLGSVGSVVVGSVGSTVVLGSVGLTVGPVGSLVGSVVGIVVIGGTVVGSVGSTGVVGSIVGWSVTGTVPVPVTGGTSVEGCVVGLVPSVGSGVTDGAGASVEGAPEGTCVGWSVMTGLTSVTVLPWLVCWALPVWRAIASCAAACDAADWDAATTDGSKPGSVFWLAVGLATLSVLVELPPGWPEFCCPAFGWPLNPDEGVGWPGLLLLPGWPGVEGVPDPLLLVMGPSLVTLPSPPPMLPMIAAIATIATRPRAMGHIHHASPRFLRWLSSSSTMRCFPVSVCRCAGVRVGGLPSGVPGTLALT